jgi:hypothetical protein
MIYGFGSRVSIEIRSHTTICGILVYDHNGGLAEAGMNNLYRFPEQLFSS